MSTKLNKAKEQLENAIKGGDKKQIDRAINNFLKEYLKPEKYKDLNEKQIKQVSKSIEKEIKEIISSNNENLTKDILTNITENKISDQVKEITQESSKKQTTEKTKEIENKTNADKQARKSLFKKQEIIQSDTKTITKTAQQDQSQDIEKSYNEIRKSYEKKRDALLRNFNKKITKNNENLFSSDNKKNEKQIDLDLKEKIGTMERDAELLLTRISGNDPNIGILRYIISSIKNAAFSGSPEQIKDILEKMSIMLYNFQTSIAGENHEEEKEAIFEGFIGNSGEEGEEEELNEADENTIQEMKNIISTLYIAIIKNFLDIANQKEVDSSEKENVDRVITEFGQISLEYVNEEQKTILNIVSELLINFRFNENEDSKEGDSKKEVEFTKEVSDLFCDVANAINSGNYLLAADIIADGIEKDIIPDNLSEETKILLTDLQNQYIATQQEGDDNQNIEENNLDDQKDQQQEDEKSKPATNFNNANTVTHLKSGASFKREKENGKFANSWAGNSEKINHLKAHNSSKLIDVFEGALNILDMSSKIFDML